ncbi:hypothetical protein FB45DRAFT_873634 [Roridomyces roridus]|uniref:Uncharacterized protein n=1 Tax=Roridomyces roridus TaxID=1738132 RepID=A0AAD7FCH8_9AGAR|nr:hypothetical protein FB45DRAFT_873634 [Roridomyces roridus]
MAHALQSEQKQMLEAGHVVLDSKSTALKLTRALVQCRAGLHNTPPFEILKLLLQHFSLCEPSSFWDSHLIQSFLAHASKQVWFHDEDVQSTAQNSNIWHVVGEIATGWSDVRGEYYTIGRNLADTKSWHPYICSEIFTWLSLWKPLSGNPFSSREFKQFTSTIWDVWYIKNREVESNWQTPRVLVSTLLCSIWDSFAFTGEQHLDALGPLVKSTLWAAMKTQREDWKSVAVPADEMTGLNSSLGAMILTAAEKSKSIPLLSQQRTDPEERKHLKPFCRI